MSRRLRGSRRADELERAIVNLFGDFEEDLIGKGISRHRVDAHIAAILIDLLRLIVTERETYSGRGLAKVVGEALREGQYEH
jgi:hypothetical protein